MANEESFRDARLVGVDFGGAELRDCRFDGTFIVDGYPLDMEISGDLVRLVVNDVDVTEYVNAELDRAYPERVAARSWTTIGEYSELFERVGNMWDETIERASHHSPEAPSTRVRGEWSLIETLRHLLFASDAWFGTAVAAEPQPYHPLGLPPSSYDRAAAASIGLTLDAAPSLDEVIEARSARRDVLRSYLAAVDDDLARNCPAPPAPGFPGDHPVRQCLRVIINEEIEHRRYIERDLAQM